MIFQRNRKKEASLKIAPTFRDATANDIDTINNLIANWNNEKIDTTTYKYEGLLQLWVACLDNKTVGFAAGHPGPCTCPGLDKNKPFFNLFMLYIIPEYRSKGIGKKFVKYFEAKVRKKGVRQFLAAVTAVDRQRTERFYEAAGYTVFCRFPDKTITIKNYDNRNLAATVKKFKDEIGENVETALMAMLGKTEH
jgi:N-acetylglutamate synthase-like GNAT family acetyltransferase